jgi:uncharacterized protein (TIGR03083 family)
MTLDHQAYLRHLRTGSARFVDVLRHSDPEAQVPSCPDWKADDLLWHLGEVQWFWGTVVEERLQDVEALEAPDRPDSRVGLVEFFEEVSGRLYDALGVTDPAEPVYMWAADKTVGYIGRRQAHEALIHRLDAELTTGDVTPLDPELASDGVDEVLRVMFGGCPPWGTFTPSGPHARVVATDTGLVLPVVVGRFTGTDPSSGTSYDEQEVSVDAADPDASPQATISGTAADLDAWLWRRGDRTRLTLEGDAQVLALVEKALDQPID